MDKISEYSRHVRLGISNVLKNYKKDNGVHPAITFELNEFIKALEFDK